MEYLDLEDVLALATQLLGDPPPVRDLGLLGSAVARPGTSVFGEDAYPELWTKAAALLQSLVDNPSLVDGNKRLGWWATAVFLELNGHPVTSAGNDEVYELVIGVAAGHRPISEIASELQQLIIQD